MPAYVRSGGAWVECIPYRREAGAWSDEDDQLYVRDDAQWKLIYPDPADVSSLLPVEGLAVTAGPTSSTVTIGWTNPTQPTTTPTHVQVRIAELGAVWTEFEYPITEASWGALDEQTEYFAQVRLVERVDGLITTKSAIRSVSFTTTEAPIGAPAPDPGGSGGDTLIPSGGDTDNPGAPSTAFGCWWEWKVQQLAENAYTWSDTALSGEADGDIANFEIDFSSLTAGVIVRVCRREACDTTGDSSADTFGDWECGIPFPAPVDWDAACAGISDSPFVAGLAAEADAVFRYPQLCKVTDTPFDRLIMRDAVTGTEIARGGGFAAFFTDASGEQGVLAGSSETTAQVVMVGGLTATSDMLAPAGDWTIISRFRANSAFSGSDGRVSSIGSWGGLRVVFQLTESATGWTPSALVTTDDGVKTLTGSEITFDDAVTHSVAVRWDDDGDLELFQDGVSQDTVAVSAISMAATPTIASYHATPGGLGLMQQLGWDRALTDDEIGSFSLGLLFNTLSALSPRHLYRTNEASGDALDYGSNPIDGVYDAGITRQDLTAPDGEDYATWNTVEQISIADDDDFSLIGARTFVWVVYPASAIPSTSIFGGKSDSGSKYEWWVELKGSGGAGSYAQILITNAAGVTNIRVDRTLSTEALITPKEAYYVIVMTISGAASPSQDLKWYINSSTEAASNDTAGSSSYTNNTADYTIGGRADDDAANFEGAIPLHATFNRVLSGSEIASIMTAATTEGWI